MLLFIKRIEFESLKNLDLQSYEEKQCLYYHVLSTILRANCDKFFVSFICRNIFIWTNQKSMVRAVAWWLAHPVRPGDSEGVDIDKCNLVLWLEQYFTFLSVVLRRAHAGLLNVQFSSCHGQLLNLLEGCRILFKKKKN